jgi:hypothetical protein
MGCAYEFRGVLWNAHAAASWVFVTVPVEVADEIEVQQRQGTAFGSVKVTVQVGETRWQTSLFPDKSVGSYVLPVKRSVREVEHLEIGDEASFTIGLVPS